MKLVLIITILLLSINLNAQRLELKTKGDKTTFELGEVVELKLTLSELNSALTISPTDKTNALDFDEFKKTVIITIKELGEYVLGPYEFSINDNVITSNSININVIPSVETTLNQDTLITIIAPKDVVKKEDFEIVIKSNVAPFYTKRIDIDEEKGSMFSAFQSLKLKDNKLVKETGSTYSSSMNFENGISTNEYTIKIKVKALKKGIFTLDSKSFDPYLLGKFDAVLINIH